MTQYQGPERRRQGEWDVALARVEGKLDAIIASTVTLTSSVTAMDGRVRDLETSMATVREKLSDIERHEPAKVNWAAVVSALAAIAAIVLVLAERIYSNGGTP